MRRLRILTWHVHGNYLWYLSQCRHDFYIPTRADGRMGYGGRGRTFPFGPHVMDVPAEAVAEHSFDCVLYQSRAHYDEDRFEILSPALRRLPAIFLEHDPPLQSPTDTRHSVDDPNTLVVHVTDYNRLMWDCGASPTRVIEHGVIIPADARYQGDLARGIFVVNHLRQRGRRLGADIYEQAAKRVPVDLVGMASEEMGGLGEVPPPEIPYFISRYRFFFNPIRYTSLGLAVCEAMMVGMPILGLATTEHGLAIQSGVTGYMDNDLDRLTAHMTRLLEDAGEARRLGEAARREACERFDIRRFADDWDEAFFDATNTTRRRRAKAAPAEELSV